MSDREGRAGRNILVHQYFGVDVTILWEIAERDLAPLVPRLEQMIKGNVGK